MVYPASIVSVGHAHHCADDHDDVQKGQAGLLAEKIGQKATLMMFRKDRRAY
jgi:hypothetical protein